MNKEVTGIYFYLDGIKDLKAIKLIKEREAIVLQILSPSKMQLREQLARSAQNKKGQLKLF